MGDAPRDLELAGCVRHSAKPERRSGETPREVFEALLTDLAAAEDGSGFPLGDGAEWPAKRVEWLARFDAAENGTPRPPPMSRAEVAAAFAVPAELVGSEPSTYATRTETERMFREGPK